jgi:hypothetical protein
MIVFAVIALFFYWQFKKIDWTKEDFYLAEPLFLAIVIALVPINWLLEWWKWTATLNVLEIHSTQKERVHSFFAGIVTGMLTPNMLGNFIGRMYYFPRSQRISLVILTLVTNYAQFIASIVFGIIGIVLLRQTPFALDVSRIYLILILLAAFVVLVYFNFEWLFRFWKRKARILNLIRNLKRRRIFRWRILGLSLLRHGIFTLQFMCMLHAFGEDFSLVSMLWIWQVYLWVTLAPSLVLGKLAIRESISIWVLAAAGMGELSVLISSFLIWTLNLLLPTLVGLVVCERKRG